MKDQQQFSAVVLGATGLVGSELVRQLLADERFSSVSLLLRRPSGFTDPKLREHIVSFKEPATWKHLVQGDVLFSALGTTIRQAGSQEAQYEVDFHYQLYAAQAASSNGFHAYVLVSSAMADPRSRIFYTRMKGELEAAVSKLSFPSITILRPGILAGDRKENRIGEKIGIALIRFVNKLGIAKSQKPIDASIVARAMINAALQQKSGITIYQLLEVFSLAGKSI